MSARSKKVYTPKIGDASCECGKVCEIIDGRFVCPDEHDSAPVSIGLYPGERLDGNVLRRWA